MLAAALGRGRAVELEQLVDLRLGDDRRLVGVALMAAARDRIARGISILVFPEAHRTRDGHLQRFKQGVFFMARDAGAPVVPIAVHGAYKINHKGTWLFTRGPVTVWVGPQVETAGLDDDALAVVIEEMRADMHEFVETGFVRERRVNA